MIEIKATIISRSPILTNTCDFLQRKPCVILTRVRWFRPKSMILNLLLALTHGKRVFRYYIHNLRFSLAYKTAKKFTCTWTRKALYDWDSNTKFFTRQRTTTNWICKRKMPLPWRENTTHAQSSKGTFSSHLVHILWNFYENFELMCRCSFC